MNNSNHYHTTKNLVECPLQQPYKLPSLNPINCFKINCKLPLLKKKSTLFSTLLVIHEYLQDTPVIIKWAVFSQLSKRSLCVENTDSSCWLDYLQITGSWVTEQRETNYLKPCKGRPSDNLKVIQGQLKNICFLKVLNSTANMSHLNTSIHSFLPQPDVSKQ